MFYRTEKANFIKQFILQIRGNTCNLVEKWTEGGISDLGEKFQIINIIKKKYSISPTIKETQIKTISCLTY